MYRVWIEAKFFALGFTLAGEDFSHLPETGVFEDYSPLLDRRVTIPVIERD